MPCVGERIVLSPWSSLWWQRLGDFCFHFSYTCSYQCGWSAYSWLLPFCFYSYPGVFKKKNLEGVTPSLKKGSAVPAWSPCPQGCRYSRVVPGRMQVLLGMASHIQGALSPPQQRREERMWVGMESEMVHEKVSCCWPYLAYIPLFCAGWASCWNWATVGHFNR